MSEHSFRLVRTWPERGPAATELRPTAAMAHPAAEPPRRAPSTNIGLNNISISGQLSLTLYSNNVSVEVSATVVNDIPFCRSV